MDDSIILKSDITALEASHPEQAKQFLTLRDQINSSQIQPFNLNDSLSSTLPRDMVSDVAQHRHIPEEFEKLIEKIRELPSFEGFLRSPLESEIRRNSEAGPIVVLNANEAQSHALIATDKDIR